MKKALITGITGQDGSYLAELLLEKGYEVHGVKRRSSSFNTERIDDIIKIYGRKSSGVVNVHYGDMTDFSNINMLIQKIKPDEIYNLAAQSHVAVSFELPEYTANVDALGTLRILESIRSNNLINKTKFYQASTSELYGLVQEVPQNENTPFYPRSPYAVAKLYSYWIVKNYRESYGIFASNGILFNHESERRGETFVTRKITRALCRIKLDLQKQLILGNIYSMRDWGHAKDYVEAMWKMLQLEEPTDMVISTGKQYSVKDFINGCCEYLGIPLEWKGDGLNEKGYDDNGNIIIKISEKYFRPSEVDNLIGDSTYAKRKINWKNKHDLKSLIKLMIDNDLKITKNEKRRI